MLAELTQPPIVLSRPEGTLSAWVPRKGLVLTRLTGRIVPEHAEEIIRLIEQSIREAPGQATVVHHWLGVESYEISVQARMTTWSAVAVRSMRRVVIGVRSPLVAFAVRTANLVAGGRFEVLDTEEQVLAAARAEWRAR